MYILFLLGTAVFLKYSIPGEAEPCSHWVRNSLNVTSCLIRTCRRPFWSMSRSRSSELAIFHPKLLKRGASAADTAVLAGFSCFRSKWTSRGVRKRRHVISVSRGYRAYLSPRERAVSHAIKATGDRHALLALESWGFEGLISGRLFYLISKLPN